MRWIAFLLPAAMAAAPAAMAAPAPRGLTVRGGELIREGKPFRAFGVNYCDLFQALVTNGDDTRTLNGLRFLGEKKIPFARFWACGFWPSDWDLYFRDKEEWFRRLDRVVRAAESAGVGLVPSLFWRTQTYPDLFDEYMDQWGEPNSRTRRFMAEYTREVVTRYRESPAIWGWEFANEMNLSCNLPNGMQFLGLKIPHLKVDLPRHERNLMTYEVANAAFKAFAEEVRRYDGYRFVTTGNSAPRPCSWHNWREKSWANDTREQMAEVYRWLNPPPINVVSVHFYPKYGQEPEFAGAAGVEAVLARHKEMSGELGMPLFVGEFAASADPKESLTMEQYRAHQTRILEAMLRAGVNLAAHWVFDYTADRKGPGLVRRDNEYAWILDQLAAYNAKLP